MNVVLKLFFFFIDLLVPKLCGLGSSSPDVAKQLEDGHGLSNVVQLAEVAALHDLVNLIGHAFTNARDPTRLLKSNRQTLEPGWAWSYLLLTTYKQSQHD